MTEDQKYCAEMLKTWGAHCRGYIPDPEPFGSGVVVTYFGSLTSFDSDSLTRLVLLSHQMSVRVEITALKLGRMEITAFRRQKLQATGENYHPGLTELIIEAAKYLEALKYMKGGTIEN